MNIIPDVNMPGLLTAILAQLGTVSTGLVHIHLFTNDLTPTKTNALGDFTEATNVEVPGYAAASANWFAGTPFRQSLGAWECPSSLPDPAFRASGSPPSPQIVYGWYATDSTDAILLDSGRFNVPFTFTLSGDGFALPGNPTLQQTDQLTISLVMPDLQPT